MKDSENFSTPYTKYEEIHLILKNEFHFFQEASFSAMTFFYLGH